MTTPRKPARVPPAAQPQRRRLGPIAVHACSGGNCSEELDDGVTLALDPARIRLRDLSRRRTPPAAGPEDDARRLE